MATIKVTYNSIARRFNIKPSTTWNELESNLRSLYNIPTTSLLTVSYTDEDGDVITLSSDLELKEVLAQQSSGRPIKLVLSTVNDWVVEDDSVVDNKSSNVEEDNNKLVQDSTDSTFFTLQQQQQQNQTEEQQTVEREEENDESRPPSYYRHVSINEEEEEPEFDQTTQTTPILNKEKEGESENNKNTKTQTEKENKEENKDDEDDDDGILFIIHRPTFFGPRFGPFGGPRFGLFDGLFGGPRHCPFGFYSRPQYYRPTFYNGYGGPSTYYFNSRQCGPNACGQKSNACNGNSKPSCYSKPQQSAAASCSKNAEASTSKSNCNRSSRPSCGQNFNYFHPRYYNQTPLTQEQLKDKLSNLHSMGFDSSNNALYEDLLKRYNGNLERVVELLLRNQQINEHYDNEVASSETLNKVDNEGRKPYVL